MDRDTAVNTIARRLGNRTKITNDIIVEMQAMQTQLESDATIRPWFLLSTVQDLTTVSGQETVNFPSDFLAEYDDGELYYYVSGADDPWVELDKCAYDDNVAFYKGASGAPEAYAVVGEKFRIFPTPDAVYTLKLIYYKKALPLTTNIENLWLKYAPQLLIAETGMVMAAYLQNKIAHAMFKGFRDSERKRLAVENTSREVANQILFMGGE